MSRPGFTIVVASLLLSRSALAGAQTPGADPRITRADSLFNAKSFSNAAALYDEIANGGPMTPRAY